MDETETEEFEEWLMTRPPVIQELARKYPPGQYKIKEKAPYSISCPGTKVTLLSYSEEGIIAVVVAPEDMLPEAIEHQKMLLSKRNALSEWEQLKHRSVRVHVDPQYLEPLTQL